MIGTYIIGGLVGLIGIIFCLARKKFSRAGILFLCVCVLTGSTIILSIPALHMHGPEPDWTAVAISWIVNICVILAFAWYSISSIVKSRTEQGDNSSTTSN
jgi:hypothetical protein